MSLWIEEVQVPKDKGKEEIILGYRSGKTVQHTTKGGKGKVARLPKGRV